MDETDMDFGVFFCKMAGKMFSAVDRAVLTARAAEADHQAAEASSVIGLYMRIHDTIDMVKEPEYFPVILKKFYNRKISACQFLIWLVTSGVMDAAAVKDISASVTGRIMRDAFMKREAADRNRKLAV